MRNQEGPEEVDRVVSGGDGEQGRPEAEAAPAVRPSERVEAEVVDDVPCVPGAGEGHSRRGGGGGGSSGSGSGVSLFVIVASTFALVLFPLSPPRWRPRRLFRQRHCLCRNLKEPQVIVVGGAGEQGAAGREAEGLDKVVCFCFFLKEGSRG